MPLLVIANSDHNEPPKRTVNVSVRLRRTIGCAALCAKLPGLCKWLYESCAAGCAKSAKCLAENETTAKACPCLSSYAELDSEDEDDEEQGRRRSATAPARTGGSSKKGSAPRPQKMKAMA